MKGPLDNKTVDWVDFYRGQNVVHLKTNQKYRIREIVGTKAKVSFYSAGTGWVNVNHGLALSNLRPATLDDLSAGGGV